MGTWLSRLVGSSLLCLLSFSCFAEECASHYSELGKTERLKQIKALYQKDLRVGMVNVTHGSYIVLSVEEDVLQIAFYTSGLFDLYPVKREGPMRLCDDGVSLKMYAIERSEELTVVDSILTVGKGGPKMTFTTAEMPDDLRRLHKVDVRGVAAE